MIQIFGYSYNNFLVFATTNLLYEDNNKNYFSLFMMFGYAIGTDSIIDISIYLEKYNNNQQNNDFYDFLKSNLTIENNIFDYISANKILLLSIPQEILIYEKLENDDSLLTNDSRMKSEGVPYILKENTNLTKNSDLYTINYQYLLKEVSESSSSTQNEDEYYYGRINRLKFKLCHDYCETCYELSLDNNNQKCLSCLDYYQYDYFYYLNNNSKVIKNCVPEGYYYDYDTNSLIECNEQDTKYYINNTNNKRICFPLQYNCPSSYSSYNQISKECFQCDVAHYKNDECTSNEFINCYIYKNCSFDDNDSLEDIYKEIKNNSISEYRVNDGSLILNNGSNYIFQITSLNNEMNNFNSNKRSNLSITLINNVYKKMNFISYPIQI